MTLKAAVITGALLQNIQPITASCPTGNCTWPLAPSLAICGACTEYSYYQTRCFQNNCNNTQGFVRLSASTQRHLAQSLHWPIIHKILASPMILELVASDSKLCLARGLSINRMTLNSTYQTLMSSAHPSNTIKSRYGQTRVPLPRSVRSNSVYSHSIPRC